MLANGKILNRSNTAMSWHTSMSCTCEGKFSECQFVFADHAQPWKSCIGATFKGIEGILDTVKRQITTWDAGMNKFVNEIRMAM